jgi:predicted ATPase
VIEYEPLEPVMVKGKADPIPIWRAKAARSPAGPQKREQAPAPFVGRGHEVALLSEAYARALREPSVQLVTLTGEPGVGKTRLVAEFQASVAEESQPVVWRQGRCLPYGDGITFWALGEIVKAQAGVLESDSPGEASEKLAAAVRQVVEEASERDWFQARLAPLVGTGAAEATAVDRSQSFAAWRRFFEAIASKEPLVLVFEDLHWADDAMLEFVEHLIDWSTGVPLLVVSTARPELYERRPGWGGGKRNSTTAALPPLTIEETAQLIGALLSQAVLPVETQAVLLERAGGNPLYAEEFVRMLGDRGILERRGRVFEIAPGAKIPLPETIQALIAARLDTLTPERKSLLQAAAVVGKVFWAGAVASVSGVPEDTVSKALHGLVSKELVRHVRTSSVRGEDEYSFWHALVRDVAYHQIPRAGRAAKHRAAAVWIERIAGERVSDLAELLAHHYAQALELARAAGADARELEEKTTRFLVLAGERALQLDVGKAESYYRRALELLPRGHPERARVLAKAAEAAWLAGHYSEAETGYAEAIAGLRAQGDDLAAGEALVKLATMVRDQGHPARTQSLLAEAVELLEREPPGAELVLAYTHTARYHHFLTSYEQGLEWAQKAMDTAKELGNEGLGMRALQYRGFIRFELGDLCGIDDLREALRLGHEFGSGEDTAAAYVNLGDLVWWTEGPAAGLEVFRAGIDFTERRGITSLATWLKAESVWTLFELGRWDELLQLAGEIFDWDRSSYMALMVLPYEAHVRLRRGQVAAAATLRDEFLPRARENNDPQIIVPALATAALIEKDVNGAASALGLVEEFREATRSRLLWSAPQLPNVLRICVAAGATALGTSLLEGIEVVAPRDRHSLQSARAVLAEAQGDLERALRLYDEAAERWAEFGFALEHGQALLGVGRCLLELDDGEKAARCVQAAREIFEALGCRPLLLEANALLERTAVGS